MNNFVLLICVVLSSIPWSALSAQDQAATQQRKHDIYSRWAKVTKAELQRPENASIVQDLKVEVKDRDGGVERIMLIRMDDQEIIDACLRDYHTIVAGYPQARVTASIAFRSAANPRLISEFIADLFREETVTPLRFEGDMSVTPLSVAAMFIIQSTLERSEAFSPAMRAWAKSIDPDFEETRKQMRAWWTLNKTVIEQGNYQAAVIPPSS